MTTKSHLTFVLVLAGCLLTGCATCSRPTSASTCPRPASAWEYKILAGKVYGTANRLDAAINEHTVDGWEFVPPISLGTEDWGFAVLRRPKK